MKARYITGSAQHIGRRAKQEDAFGFSKTDPAFEQHAGTVAVLADGMGGLAHGELASKAAVEGFLSAYHAKTAQEGIPEAFERALHAANQAVWLMAKRIGAGGSVGATLVAAALHNDSLRWISVGDSGLFLFRNGRLAPLTVAHTYARELDRQASAGTISKEAALSHPERSALTSYVGLARITEVDRDPQPFRLQAGDVVVLASDGLFNTLSLEQMRASMGGTPRECCRALVAQTIAAGRDFQDNVTVIAVGAGVAGESVPVPASKASQARWYAAGATAVALASGGWWWWKRKKGPAESKLDE